MKKAQKTFHLSGLLERLTLFAPKEASKKTASRSQEVARVEKSKSQEARKSEGQLVRSCTSFSYCSQSWPSLSNSPSRLAHRSAPDRLAAKHQSETSRSSVQESHKLEKGNNSNNNNNNTTTTQALSICLVREPWPVAKVVELELSTTTAFTCPAASSNAAHPIQILSLSLEWQYFSRSRKSHTNILTDTLERQQKYPPLLFQC